MCCDSFLQGKKQLLALEGTINPNRTLLQAQLPWCRLPRGQSRCSYPVAVSAMIADSLADLLEHGRCLGCPDLVAGDNPADYRSSPVIVRGNQSPSAIVQLQVGSANGVGTPNWLSSGPMARTITLFGCVP